MLYTSNRWQSTRHIVRKHVLIFLQQRDNNIRQRFIKFVSIKTCPSVQEYKYRLVCIKSTLDITRLSIKTNFFFFVFLSFFSLSIFFSLSFFLSFSFSSSFFEHSVSQFFFNSLFLSISFNLHTLVLESTVQK